MPKGRTALVVALALALMLPAGTARAADPNEFVIRFPHPVSNVRFSNDYGIFAKDRIHRGVDIFSPRGTAVVAVADGFVTRTSYGRNAGYYVVLRHADGWESWYLHLNPRIPGGGGPFAPGIERGAFVKAGQLVGAVGTTGNALGTHPHTHFELHRRGRWVNPYPHLVGAWRRQLMEWALAAGETPYR